MKIVNVVLDKNISKTISEDNVKIIFAIINPKMVLDEHLMKRVRRFGIIVGHTELDTQTLESSLMNFDFVDSVEFPEVKTIVERK